MPIQVKFRRLPGSDTLPLPSYARPGDSGIDLCAAEETIVAPGGRRRVRTGFAIEIPEGYEGQIRPRSGLAAKNGITVLNAPGTLDSSFRGEIEVLLFNADRARMSFRVRRGERIAQLVIAPVVRAEIVEVEELTETERGAGGFGSTGIG